MLFTVDPPTPLPPIPPLSGLAKKQRYWKMAEKGVIYNQQKTYSRLENQRRYSGGGGQRDGRARRYWVGRCDCKLLFHLLDKWRFDMFGVEHDSVGSSSKVYIMRKLFVFEIRGVTRNVRFSRELVLPQQTWGENIIPLFFWILWSDNWF